MAPRAEADMMSAGRRTGGRTGRRGNLTLAFGLAVVLGVAALVFLSLSGNEAEPFMLAVLGALAAAGIFALFSLAVGILHFGSGPAAPSVASLAAETDRTALVVTDAGGRPVWGNAAWLALSAAVRGGSTGLAAGSGLAGVERVLPPEGEAAEALQRLTASARDGLAAEAEIRLTRAIGHEDGPARWYRLSVQLLPDGPEGLGLRAWRLRDVTAERREQEDSFLDLQNAIDFLDRAPAGFFSVDAAGRVVFLNATLADWLGHDLARFESGSVPLNQIVRGEGAGLLGTLTGRPGDSRTETLDLDLVRRDGHPLPVRLLHRVTFGPDGQPDNSRTLVISRVPGSGAAVDESLRAAEVRFARFFNNTPIAIASLDREGRISRGNAPFLKLFGSLAQSAPGEPRPRLVEAVVDRDRRGLQDALAAAGQGQSAVPPVEATLAGEGGQRSVRFYVSVVEDAGPAGGDDDDDAIIVSVLDTTEQRALEQQFTQSQKMQAIGQLAGGVAHDFNNVLTAIIGFSDLLLASHRPTDPFFQDIMNIKQNANRAAGLVRQLLAFATRQTLRPERIVLTDVLADLTILLDRLLGEQVDLKVIHGRDLWPIMADVNQLEQVVINLAVNARDAMPEGGTLTIRTANVGVPDLRTFQEGKGFGGQPLPATDHVLIEISDTGTGMPQHVMEKIFEPFFSTKEVGKGTGLGLSTVYGIVTQSGGRIAVESEIGRGTVFRILWPRARAEVARLPAESERVEGRRPRPPEPQPAAPAIRAPASRPVPATAAPVPAEAPPPEAATDEAVPPPRHGPPGGEAPVADLTGSASILLVEDEEAVRAFAARALASRGYTVHQASTGAEALKVMAAAEGGIDLVVSDVVMPEMDGPSLLRELRKTRPDLKIVFVSGYAEEAFARNLPENEHFSFLPKPFTLKQLATAVKTALAD